VRAAVHETGQVARCLYLVMNPDSGALVPHDCPIHEHESDAFLAAAIQKNPQNSQGSCLLFCCPVIDMRPTMRRPAPRLAESGMLTSCLEELQDAHKVYRV
jgi:hypothetical protein